MFLLEETILCDWLVPGLHPNYGHFTGSLRMLTGSFSTNLSEFQNWTVCIAVLRRYFSILYCMYVLYILNRTVCIVYSQSRILSIPKFLVKSIYECTIIRVWVKIEDAGNRRYRTGGTMSITMYRLFLVILSYSHQLPFSIFRPSVRYMPWRTNGQVSTKILFRVHIKIQMDVSPLRDGIISFEPFLSWFGPLLSVAHPRLAPQRKNPVPTP